MKEIRLAVHALGENELGKEFLGSLENLQTENSFDTSLNVSKEIETVSPNIKSVLYKNIQEAVINSIKHGRSKHIYIKLE